MCSCEPILVVLRSLELGHPGLYPWPLKGWRWRARDGPLLNEWIAREMRRDFCPCFVKSLADCFQSIRAEGGSINELAGLHGRDPCSSKCLSIGVSRLKWKGRRLPCVAWELCHDGPLSDPTMRDVGAMPDTIRKHGGRSGGIVRIRTNIAD